MRICRDIDWVNAKRCRENAARYYARLLTSNNISYRLHCCEDKLLIDVPRSDLHRCKELLDEQPFDQGPPYQEIHAHGSSPLRAFAGILLGATCGAFITDPAWSPPWGSLVPAFFAIGGCIVALAAKGPRNKHLS